MSSQDGETRPPARTWVRALTTGAWFVPAAVLAVSGAAKIVDPAGAVPRSLLRITEFLPYSIVLRALGVFELVVAGHLVVPRTRRAGAFAAAGLFAAFAWLAASNAADREFLANCGCFGGLADGAAAGPFRGLGVILLRNALLCGLLAAFLHATSRERRPWWRSLAVGAAGAALVFFATGFVGARRLADEDARVQAALRGARQLFPGVPLPEIALVAPDGTQATSRTELREGDHVLFFSPDCPHCRALAPSLAAFSREAALRGGRLVLLAVTAPADVAEFKRTFSLSDVPHWSVPERLDPFRWGVDSVPMLVVLGAQGRLRYHQALPASATFAESLASIDARAVGFADAALRRIADRLAGEGSRIGPSRHAGSFEITDAQTAAGESVHLCVVTVRGNPPYTMELALCVDASGALRGGVVPLTLAGYASAVDPAGAFLTAFDGRTLAGAAREAERRAGEPSMQSPLYESAALVFASLADELAPKEAAASR